MQSTKTILLASLALVLFVNMADAQTNKITVSGTVTDPSGAVVAGAQIVLKLEKCKCSDCKLPEKCDCCPSQISASTDGAGHYSFSVPHGTYIAVVSAGDRQRQVEFNLNDGTATTYDVQVK